MKKTCLTALACSLTLASLLFAAHQRKETKPMDTQMQLGNFSVSLTVKDIHASKSFYEKMDFKPVGGNIEQNWIIMQNGTTTIGLFHGMFENNIMTFNPGWDKDQKILKHYQDVRELQSTLKSRGIQPVTEADDSTTGPANFIIVDPDGNTILFDQHVPSPKDE